MERQINFYCGKEGKGYVFFSMKDNSVKEKLNWPCTACSFQQEKLAKFEKENK